MTSFEQFEEPTDTQLVQQARAGNAMAFAALVDRHRTRLKHLLRTLLHNAEEVEDIWQETLLSAFLGLESLREPESFRAWICTIGLNLARNHRRRDAPALLSLEQIKLEDAEQNSLSPEASALRGEDTERIRAAIVDLPPAERDAIMLVYLGELSHQETAEQLGTSLSAVKVRVHRGRKRLHRALVGEFGTQPPPTEQESQMIPVTIHDIVLQTKKLEKGDTVNDSALDLLKLSLGHRIILLKEADGERILPIWVGPYEGDAIALQLKNTETKRPITFDLTRALLDFGEVKLDRIVISRLHETTFYSNVLVTVGDKSGEIDARPSDALNLALRLKAPIFVARELMTDASKTAQEWAASEDDSVERQSILELEASYLDNDSRYRKMVQALGWALDE